MGQNVTSLTNGFPKLQGSYYHIVFGNLFTSLQLQRLLAENRMAALGTPRLNRVEVQIKVKKQLRGFYDVVLERNDEVCVVRWHDIKIAIASTYAGIHPLQKAEGISSRHKQMVDVDNPKVFQKYNC